MTLADRKEFVVKLISNSSVEWVPEGCEHRCRPAELSGRGVAVRKAGSADAVVSSTPVLTF